MVHLAVGDVMTKELIRAKPDDSLLYCAKLMVRERIDSLLIAENRRLKGILTSRDILWAVTKKQGIDLSKMKAIDIATRKVAVIKPSADIIQALEKMRTLNFRRLPVLSRGELVGVITLKDILRIEPTLYGELGELAEIKEESRKLQQARLPWPIEGLCTSCGAFSDLVRIDGKLLCPDCRDELY